MRVKVDPETGEKIQVPFLWVDNELNFRTLHSAYINPEWWMASTGSFSTFTRSSFHSG